MSAQPTPIRIELEQNTPEWLAERRKHIGASDVPVIIGAIPKSWKRKPCDIMASKREDAIPFEENEDMRLGHELEPLVLMAYGLSTGNVSRPGGMYLHPVNQWASASIDGEHIEDGTPVEVKTTNERAWRTGEWGESGTDVIPSHYFIQTQWQMYVTGASRVVVVAFAAPRETRQLIASMYRSGADEEMLCRIIEDIGLRVYEIIRDDALIASMVDIVGDFWRRHVIGGEPCPDYGRMQDDGRTVQADELQEGDVAALRMAWLARERAKTQYEEAEEAVQKAIGERSAITTQAMGCVTWKKNRDTVAPVTDWPAVVAEIAAELGSPEVVKAITEKHTKEQVMKKGARVFRVPAIWKESI